MTRLHSFLITVLATCAIFTSNAQALPDPDVTMLPYPQSLTHSKGVFCVDGATFNYDKELDKASIKAIKQFAARFGAKAKKAGDIQKGGFNFLLDSALETEAYTLDINTDKVIVKAGSHEGIFYAIQTLKQLLPAEVYGKTPVGKDWTLNCMSISDNPRYGYRGLNVDVCRHFYGVNQIKKFIDLMAAYKLTKVGAYREGTQIGKDFNNHDGKRYGGSSCFIS